MIEKIKKDIKASIARPVLPEGNPHAKIVFIGEAGGAEEEKVGRPFVGRAGKFLEKEFRKFGIRRDKVYITNVVKYRSVGTPKKKDIERCLGWLKLELESIKPKIVVLLGKTAEKYTPRVKGSKYIALPHPAAAMRFPQQRKKFEAGMKKIKRFLN